MRNPTCRYAAASLNFSAEGDRPAPPNEASRPKPPEKVKLGVYLDRDLVDDLRAYAAQAAEGEGGYRRGLLSEIVEDAIRLYLQWRPTRQRKPRNVEDVYLAVLNEAQRRLRHSPLTAEDNMVSGTFLRDVIGAVRGTDFRTIHKWWKLFEKYGYIYRKPGDPAPAMRMKVVL